MIKHLVCLAAVVSVVGFEASSAQAVVIPVPNFSFENPVRSGGQESVAFAGDSNNSVLNWDFAGPFTLTGGVYNALPAQFASVPAGSQFAYLGTRNTGDVATLTLTSSTNTLPTITAGIAYTLTVAIGHRLDNVYPAGNVAVSLLAGSTVVSTASINANSITMGTFSDLSTTLTAAQANAFAGQQLSIQIAATNTSVTGNTHNEGDFDNVRLVSSAAVPEPASLGVLALGTCALLAKRRRRAG